MTGDEALPRKNGELAFNEPWEDRAFGLAAALTESGASSWADFRDRLIKVTATEHEHGGETATTNAASRPRSGWLRSEDTSHQRNWTREPRR